MPHPESERRRSARHSLPVPLHLRGAGAGEISGVAEDLSDSGLSFRTPEALGEGALVSLRLPIGSEEYRLTAAVAWCRGDAKTVGFRAGAYFLRPPMAFRLALAEEVGRIRELRRKLSRDRGQEVTGEEAARERIASMAARHPEIYERDATQRS